MNKCGREEREQERKRHREGEQRGKRRGSDGGRLAEEQQKEVGEGERHGNKEGHKLDGRLCRERPSNMWPVLRPDSTNGADVWCIRICMQNKGLNGAGGQNCAQNGPTRALSGEQHFSTYRSKNPPGHALASRMRRRTNAREKCTEEAPRNKKTQEVLPMRCLAENNCPPGVGKSLSNTGRFLDKKMVAQAEGV